MSIPVVLLMMRNSIRLLLLIVACLGLACLLQAEIRAIWVLPWSTNTPQKIDKFIADAACARQTDIMIEVRYRSDALYQTNRTPDPYPNPEPPSYILNGSDFDPLAYALEKPIKITCACMPGLLFSMLLPRTRSESGKTISTPNIRTG